LKKKRAQIEKELARKEVWQDYKKARVLNEELVFLKKKEENFLEIEKILEEILFFKEKIDETELLGEIAGLERKLESLEKYFLFQGEYDKNNAYLMLQAGAGGTDACDWVKILLRMYLKFFEKKKWQAKIIDQSPHLEAGFRSATLEITGRYVYGFLKGEKGVHRLVRISPFDAEKMRHTSFALVEVLPQIEEAKVEINEKDLKIETFLASGHGGQNVQKRETAVRIIHLPTGLSASSQSERSQLQNKKQALRILEARLFLLSSEEKEKEKLKLKGEKKSISWGNQVRSYVFHPYQLVKDLRTQHETSDLESVLEGELEPFIDAYLKLKR